MKRRIKQLLCGGSMIIEKIAIILVEIGAILGLIKHTLNIIRDKNCVCPFCFKCQNLKKD